MERGYLWRKIAAANIAAKVKIRGRITARGGCRPRRSYGWNTQDRKRTEKECGSDHPKKGDAGCTPTVCGGCYRCLLKHPEPRIYRITQNLVPIGIPKLEYLGNTQERIPIGILKVSYVWQYP